MNWKRYFRNLDRLYSLWFFVILGGLIFFQERIDGWIKFLVLSSCALLWLLVKQYTLRRKRSGNTPVEDTADE